MQKVIINPSYGGTNSGKIFGNFIEKDYNLNLAKLLQTKLTNLGINTFLTRTSDENLTNQERLNKINNYININDEAIVLTLQLIDNQNNESGSQIVYALRDKDILPRDITDNLQNIGLSVIKYYQLRNPNNTSNDFYELIKDPTNSLNIILSLGNPNNSFDNGFMQNNIDKIANSIANSINTYFASNNIYIIQRGDTLFSIANKFNLTVDELKEANNLSSNALIVGEELIIPSTKELDNIETGNDEEMNMYIDYIVKKGDSLYSIAKLYNTSIDILKDVNNLETNNLSINQVIKIPTSTSSTISNYDNYIVKKGDSLYSISKTFNTTVSDIVNLNNLTSNNLSIGQILKIPNIIGGNEQTNNYSSYTVKSGDSLYKIASLYNTSVNDIKNLNNLTSNNLSIGQILKIPSSSNSQNNFVTYTVKSGDSLYKIANNYNTKVNEIKELNNLTNNNLSIGQLLKIKTK